MQRIAVYVCAALSASLIVLDAAGGGLDRSRPDLALELVARVLMVVLAVAAAARTRGDPTTELLLWAVLCVSFDAYWQTTYRHLGGKPLEWIEMFVKYVAVGLGLGLLLRVCATFGDAPADRFRSAARGWWLGAAAALTAVGLWHGASYIRSCYYFMPGRDQCIVSGSALVALDAYLIADAVLRLAIVAAAVSGYVRSSRRYKQRTLLVAAASVVFALGTVANFLARLQFGYDVIVVLEVVDAVTTVLFPLALLYAATRRQLFDVEYVVQRSISSALATLIVGALWALVLVYATPRELVLTAFGVLIIALAVLFRRQVTFGYGVVSRGLRRARTASRRHAVAECRNLFRRALESAAALRPKVLAGYARFSYWVRPRRTLTIFAGLMLALAVIEVGLHQLVYDWTNGFIESDYVIMPGVRSMLATLHVYDTLRALGLKDHETRLHYAVGIPFALGWVAIEERLRSCIDGRLFKERERRLEELRSFTGVVPLVRDFTEIMRLLHEALGHAVLATFADIFVHRGDGVYVPVATLTTRKPLPPPLRETEPPLSHLVGDKCLSLGCKRKDLPGLELVVPMVVGAERFGTLVCGPPDGADLAHFGRKEIKAISAFAAMAGKALFPHREALAARIHEEVR